MKNDNLVVISKKIHNGLFVKVKAFFLSLFIHVALFGAIYEYAIPKKISVTHKSEMMVVSLVRYSPPYMSEPNSQVKPKKVKKLLKPAKKILQKTKEVHKVKTSQKIKPKKVISSEAFTPQVKDLQKPAEEEVTNQVVSKTETLSEQSPLISSDLSLKHTQKKEISDEELARIRALIQNSLRYPKIARKLKIEGVVHIAFSLCTDGRIENLFILQSSGSSSLDKRALQTVSSLDGEYPTLSKKIDLQIPISFSLQQS